MKKVILALVIIMGISVTSFSQSSGKMKMKEKSMAMKEGVMMADNKPMLCSHSKCTPLVKTYICKDGCKVSTDGTVTKPDGTTMKLQNGYQIDKMGKVSMIQHGQKGHVCGPDCPMHDKM